MAPTESDRPEAGHPPDAPGHGDGVGTVAEEAARLVELLAGPDGPWAGARAAATRDATADAWPGGGSPNGTSHNGTSREQTPPDEGPHDSEPARGVGAAGGTDRRCTCGGSTPQACRLCPVCQFIALVGSISPETIERAADVVGLAATALRDLAVVQRERQAARDARPPADGGRS